MLFDRQHGRVPAKFNIVNKWAAPRRAAPPTTAPTSTSTPTRAYLYAPTRTSTRTPTITRCDRLFRRAPRPGRDATRMAEYATGYSGANKQQDRRAHATETPTFVCARAHQHARATGYANTDGYGDATWKCRQRTATPPYLRLIRTDDAVRMRTRRTWTGIPAGQRDPTHSWDFFDAPSPALPRRRDWRPQQGRQSRMYSRWRTLVPTQNSKPVRARRERPQQQRCPRR